MAITSLVKKINRKKQSTSLNLIARDYNISHLKNIELYTGAEYTSEDVLSSDIDVFQSILRKERLCNKQSIKLVAFDISRTLIEYHSTHNMKLKAAKLIVDYLDTHGISVNENDVIESIEKGFAYYAQIRYGNGIERDEVDVYKEHILPHITQTILDEDIVCHLIEIWKEHSVETTLVATKIKDLVNELRIRDVLVVTVSDMLGDMSFRALKKHDIYDIFDAHFCSNEYGIRKSNDKNSLYEIVSKVMAVDPQNCLMIGNDIVDDIESSRKVGFHSIYVTFGNSIDNVNADQVVESTDYIYDLYLSNKIHCLPRTELTPYTQSSRALRLDEELNQLQYQLRAYAKFIPNRSFRSALYHDHLASYIGSGTRIGNNLEIRYPSRIYIGGNCQINDDVTILNEGIVLLGNNIMVARNVFISTYHHNWTLGMMQNETESWAKGNTSLKCVSIESNTWIGPGCVIEADVVVGHHSVIAANSFVKSGIYPPYSFIAGCPAKVKDIVHEKLKNYRKAHRLKSE